MDDALYGSVGPMGGADFQSLVNAYRQQDTLEKAYTTGSGVVQPGDTTPANFRTQFLSDTLEQVSYSQTDAGFMHDIAKEKIGSVTAEWSSTISYGGAGDNFVGETGSDGNFNVSGADDQFLRQIQNAKFMANYRQVSSVAQVVKSLTDPMQAAMRNSQLELIGKMNLALYYGNENLNTLQWNGISAQVGAWATAFPGDSAILYDAGGKPLTQYLMEDIIKVCSLFYGKPTELRCSVQTYTDAQKTLFPEARYTEGTADSRFGTHRNRFLSPYGDIMLKYDKMLRVNRPLVANGTGVDGKPRAAGYSDTGSLTYAATPWAACAAVSAGNGNFWQNSNTNKDAGTLANAPAVPSGDGNQANRLATGSYIYAVSAVVNGRESAPWVFGAAGPNTTTGATAVTTTGPLPIVQIDLDPTQLVAAGGVLRRAQTYFRVYRAPSSAIGGAAGGPACQFDWLENIGIPLANNARGYDNGYRIPGTDTAFLLSPENNGSKQVFLGQLLPLMTKTLPLSAMADQKALLFFGTPIVRVGRFQVVVRNIGKFVNP